VKMERPSEETFRRQLAFLKGYANIRTDRAGEILDQIGVITPFQASVAFLRTDTKPRTIELLETAFRLAAHVEHRFKHSLACRRPIELSPQVQPIIETPTHGTLPSGHATEAFTAALVLWELLKDVAVGDKTRPDLPPYQDELYGVQLMRLASRIAVNRTVAGVHFPIDSVAGAVLGLTLGQYLVARANPEKGKGYHPAHFDGRAEVPEALQPEKGNRLALGDLDFHWSTVFDVQAGAISQADKAHPSVKLMKDGADPSKVLWVDLSKDARSSPLEWLWAEARREWT
jgi:membrane-associated phospholipid phosphatase